MPKIVASYPAYDIVEAPVHTLTGLPILKDGDTLSLKERNHLGSYTIGSVASSAIADGSCPYEARERALGFGHDLYFIFANAACITAHEREKETHIEVHYGMEVLFEGVVFTIEKAPNNNLKLVKVCTLKERMYGKQQESQRQVEEQ